jgi:paraquat-inducible protein A
MIIICHECDKPHQKWPIPEGATAKCSRCGAILYSSKRNSLERTLALTLAGLILFVIANTYPFLAMKIEGQIEQTTLITGVKELFGQKMYGVCLLVLLTSVVFPLFEICGLLYILIPMKFNRKAWRPAYVFRLINTLHPWAMMEVFMLGILVSLVKLAKMAEILPGLGLYAFMALIFMIAAVHASLDHDMIWSRFGGA